jgi:hypothetical protein
MQTIENTSSLGPRLHSACSQSVGAAEARPFQGREISCTEAFCLHTLKRMNNGDLMAQQQLTWKEKRPRNPIQIAQFFQR